MKENFKISSNDERAYLKAQGQVLTEFTVMDKYRTIMLAWFEKEIQ